MIQGVFDKSGDTQLYDRYFITPDFTIETIYDDQNSSIFYLRTTKPLFTLHGCPIDTKTIFISNSARYVTPLTHKSFICNNGGRYRALVTLQYYAHYKDGPDDKYTTEDSRRWCFLAKEIMAVDPVNNDIAFWGIGVFPNYTYRLPREEYIVVFEHLLRYLTKDTTKIVQTYLYADGPMLSDHCHRLRRDEWSL